MRRKKLVSTLLCATVLTASLTIGAAAATPEDHIYRGDHATCTRAQIMTFLYRDEFGGNTGNSNSSSGQTTAPETGENSFDQRISALMAEGYTKEEAREIMELMAGGYSEESSKEMVRMTQEELNQRWQDVAEELGGYYNGHGGLIIPGI